MLHLNPKDITLYKNLEDVFGHIINKLECQNTTKAYISNVLFKKLPPDYSGESVTLILSQAKFAYSFELYQNLGDWILFCQSTFPDHLKDASPEYYSAVAQECYYRCYKIVNKKWLLFEELADNLPQFVDVIHKHLR